MDNFEDIKVKGTECPMFRVSYESIHKPKSFEGQEPKYGLTMLFDKKTVPIKKSRLWVAAMNAGKEKFGSKWKVGPNGEWPKEFKCPFRDGDQADKPDYEGMIFVRATAKKKPGLVDEKLDPIASDDEGQATFYSGCYARATLIAFAYDFSGNKGVSFAVTSVQKLKNGKRFGGGRDAASEFEAVEVDTSDDNENPENYDDLGY